MTPATDDDALEAAFEAFLAGRSAPPAAEGLVAFADGVRASAARPPRPNAALAELLATGLLTDQSSAPAPRAVRPRRRSTRRMFLAFFAKLTSAGLAAKAATVAGVVVVGVSTAGFAHDLPTPMQATWDHVLTHDEPSAPTATDGGTATTGGTDAAGAGDPSGSTTTPATSSAPESDDAGDAGDADGAKTPPPAVPAQQTSTHPENFGGTVSSMAHDGGVDGGTVSSMAHDRNDARRSGATWTPPTSPSTAGDDSAASGKGSDSKGKGHSNG